jgi:hypothetical protein
MQTEQRVFLRAKLSGGVRTKRRTDDLDCGRTSRRPRVALEEATNRLKPQKFSPDQIADDPVVRRAAGKVRNLELILSRIQNEAVDVTWRPFARDLLKD